MPPKLLKNKYYMQNIPSVDLRDFLSDDRKQKFVNEIGSAFEDIGFVALKVTFK
jgi:isopenicillin N synthase-like dioxygenase